jgi:KaiC/GvpD/RAD55 family RecA-like ATPase
MFVELLTLSLRYDVVLQVYSSDFDWKPWGTGLGVLVVIACIVFATINLVREGKDKKIGDMTGTLPGTAEIKESPPAAEIKPDQAKETFAELEIRQEPAEKGKIGEPAIVETNQEPEVRERPVEVKPSVVHHSEFAIALDRLEEKSGRVSMGIASLDKLIGGGLLPSKIYLLSGEAGTGKTSLGLQFLHHGLIHGENGIYVSGDDKHSKFLKDQKFGGWDFSGHFAVQKLGLFDISPYFSELRSGEVKEIDVPALFDNLTQQVNSTKASRIVIDPLVPAFPDLADITVTLKYISNLISSIKNNLHCTVLVTSTINPGSVSLSTRGIEEFLAEGVITLKLAEMGGRIVHTLSVKKMPSSFTHLSDHVVEILPNGGIVIKE